MRMEKTVAPEGSARRTLQRRLLALLAEEDRARNPDIGTLILENRTGTPEWESGLGRVIQPYTSLLTLLHDLDRGLDHFGFVVERVQATSDVREWEFHTQQGTVVYMAVLQRLEDLSKRFWRSKLIDRKLLNVVDETVAALREDSGLVHTIRNQTAHAVEGDVAFSRIPETTRMCDVYALLEVDADMLEVRATDENGEVGQGMQQRLDQLTQMVDNACLLLSSLEWRQLR